MNYQSPKVSIRRALPSQDIEIEGYAALWGSPTQTDCYGTYFSKDNPPEMGLDLLPLPYLLEHNETENLKRARIGKVVEMWLDDKGVKYRAILDHTAPLFHRAIEIIKRATGYTSTGSAEHLAKFGEDGRFVDWLLSEISLTETPCETRMKNVEIVRADDLPKMQVALVRSISHKGTDAPCSCGCGSNSHNRRGALSIMASTLQELGLAGMGIDQIGQALIDQYGADLVSTVYNNVFAAENAPIDDLGALEAAAASAYPDVDPASLMALVDILYAVIHEMPDQVAALVQMLSAPPAPAEDSMTMSAPDTAPVLQEIQRKARRLPKVRTMPTPNTPDNSEVAQLRAQMARMEALLTAKPADATPTRKAPFVNEISDKYDTLSAAEMAAGYQWMRKLHKSGKLDHDISEEYRKALAARIEDDMATTPAVRKAYTRAGYPSVRANELMGSTVSSAGDEWVGVYYDNSLWEKIRQAPFYQEIIRLGLVEREVPKGYESVIIPTEGADPTWYVTPQSVSEDGSGHALTKLDSSKPGTGQKSLTVAKLGSAVSFTGELDEDSIVPMLPELLRRFEVSAQEQIEYLLINGDTATGANTNINLIDGTPTAATLGGMPSYTLVNGFLKLALVTTTSNSFDMSGAPVSTDFLDLLKKMGTNGRDGLSDKKQLFIVDNLTYAAVLAAIAADTNGQVWASASPYITGERDIIWGRPLFSSGQMALANSAGKIPAAGGTLGRICAVRPDRWTVGWKRRTTTEVERDARADTTQIVTYMRWGLASFDGESSAVAYNGTV